MRLVRFFVVLVLLSLMNMAMAQNSEIRVKHKVQKSETVFGIAKRYGVTIEELIAVNPEMILSIYLIARKILANKTILRTRLHRLLLLSRAGNLSLPRCQARRR